MSAAPSRARVNVLVRTTGRSSLAEALLSVLAQTMPDFAIKLVMAADQPLPIHLPGLSDPRVELVAFDRVLTRSAAANRALDAATSEFALFLDDDDLLLPDHLQRLTQALASADDAVAAYAGVRCERAGSGPAQTLQVFDGDVSRAQMQLENRLPIHAVLFRLAAVRQAPALHFNEQLDQFEDWDFWLQVMSRGRFVRVPGVSAIYRLDVRSGSGHADASNPTRRVALEGFAGRQLQRWTERDAADLIEQHAELKTSGRQLEQELAELRQTLGKLQLVQADLTLRVQQAERERAELVSTRLHLGQALDEVGLLRQALAEHRDEVARLGAAREELLSQSVLQAQAVATVRAQSALQGQAINALHASTSWRVTRPLRSLGDAWSALRSGRLRKLPTNLLLALQSQQRRHGWAGMATRLPSHLMQWRRHWRTLSVPAAALTPTFTKARAHAAPTVRLHPEIEGCNETLDHSVTVVIPTLNGGVEFMQLLRKLRQQRGLRDVQIVVVDSGSRDDTVRWAREAGAQVVEITPAEFSHSHARNLGAEAARGDFIVFMVQDAYPIGQLWLYGMLRWLLDHSDQGVVAASCAEYCRSDSDLMYDSMVNTHYRFLGCLHDDRIGQHAGDDHMALRSMGQLSDVACMIGRQLFLQHRYRGDYAEDLDLGIRLIQQGHRVAMLASVKVIHSHNRTAYYYLKRSFVDVIFLVGLFKDFGFARCASVPGLIEGVRATASRTASWLQALPGQAPAHGLDVLAPRRFAAPPLHAGPLGDEALERFIDELGSQISSFAPGTTNQRAVEARQFDDAFLARVDHLHQFARTVYGPLDERLVGELAGAVRKTLAATLGAALAYTWLDRRERPSDDPERQWIDGVFATLKAGV